MNISRHSGREQQLTEARPTATTCRDRPLRHEPALGKLSGKSLDRKKSRFRPVPGTRRHRLPHDCHGASLYPPGPPDRRNRPGINGRTVLAENDLRRMGWTALTMDGPVVVPVSNRPKRPAVPPARPPPARPIGPGEAPNARRPLAQGTGDRPKGSAILPARPSGPGTTPNDMCRPNGPTIPLPAHTLSGTVGPLGRTGWWDGDTRAYDPGWENGWPLGPDDGPFEPKNHDPPRSLRPSGPAVCDGPRANDAGGPKACRPPRTGNRLPAHRASHSPSPAQRAG